MKCIGISMNLLIKIIYVQQLPDYATGFYTIGSQVSDSLFHLRIRIKNEFTNEKKILHIIRTSVKLRIRR
ncbi:MAG: hypothetical protein HY841_04940 [Bacteroidetes bacterium]|nr:hypothetical protein [Bacteroidota bacterium]